MAKDLLWPLKSKAAIKADFLQGKKARITLRVEELIKEESHSTESAVTKVMQEYDCSRASVFAAMRESKKHPDIMMREKHHRDISRSINWKK